MKCNRCGSQMREKDVVTGEDEYGDPIYSRYAFCDNCRVKRKLADDVEPHVPAQRPPKKAKRREVTEDLPAVEYRKKSRKKKKSASVLNSLILILGIINIVLIIFIIFVLNRHHITSLEGIKNLLPSKTSSYEAPLPEEPSPDLSLYGVSSEEFSEFLM